VERCYRRRHVFFNGVVYVGSNDGSLYAFALPTPAAATFAPPERPEPATLRPDLKLILQHQGRAELVGIKAPPLHFALREKA
jgi:hypothetical protein